MVMMEEDAQDTRMIEGRIGLEQRLWHTRVLQEGDRGRVKPRGLGFRRRQLSTLLLWSLPYWDYTTWSVPG